VIRKYLVCVGLGMQDALEYRANFLLSMVSVVFPVFVQLFLWLNLFGNDTGETLFGYTFPQMLSYVLYANIISRLIRTNFEYEINRDIKDGALSVFIVKPMSYFFYRLSSFIGKKLIHSATIFLLLVCVAVYLLLAYNLIAPPTHIGFFVLSLFFAFLLNFAIFFTVGMLGFWFQDIGFLFEAARIIIIVFSGGVFPLDVFGEPWKTMLFYLPFSYTTYFPVDLLSGRLPAADAINGLCIDFFWLVVISLLAMRLFSTGMKRYSASGG
jgi:ABC-2 type transport system permease protein